MGKIFLTSDWHFGHDREFVWGARGFHNVHEMNEAIIERHNSLVGKDDDVYVLGDLALGGGGAEALENAQRLIERLNGRIHIVLGNHDTAKRAEMYQTCLNVVEVCGWATMLKYKGYHFYLSHFPTMTGNLEKETLKQCTINLFGHTHQKEMFYQDIPFMFHVGQDSHNCYPVLLDNAIEAMKDKVKECYEVM